MTMLRKLIVAFEFNEKFYTEKFSNVQLFYNRMTVRLENCFWDPQNTVYALYENRITVYTKCIS